MVHRDVKPANLIVEPEGRVWLTDFGLARRLIDVSATITGTIMGTPRYMSPEQASLTGAEVDHRSDIYSLGATLYESATGRPPIEGDDPLKVITQIREDDPPSPRQLRRELSRDLGVVILKAMAKHPSDRYQTASELAEDLRAVQEGRAVGARGLSTWERTQRWSRKNQARVRLIGTAVAATAAAILCAFIAWSGYRDSRRGEFLLRASGGPFTARFYSIDEQNRRELKTSLTVPMQNPQTLEAGDYEVQLAPTGRWSSMVRMPVQRGAYQDFRLRRTKERRREISIEDASAMPIMGFSEAAVLHTKGSLMSRMTIDESRDWTLDVSAIRVEVTELPTLADDPVINSVAKQAVAPQKPPVVDFGFDNSRREDWVYDRLYADTTQSNPMRALRSPIDLDGDGRSETIVAADRAPALMAVNADGKKLWARCFEFYPVKRQQQQRDNIALPGIVSILDVGDVNQDGINDLVASLTRVQPTIQTDVALAWISGRDGTVIQTRRMPSIVGAQQKCWPLDGGLRYMMPRTRCESNIAFGTDGVTQNSFSRSRELDFSWFSSDGRTSGFALPSPLKLLEDSSTLIYLAGKSCHRLDVQTGAPLGTPFDLPHSMPECLPQQTRVGDEQRLLFVGVPVPDWTSASSLQQMISFDLDGHEQWRKVLHEQLYRANFAYRHSSWPVVDDLDGDGEDELIVLLDDMIASNDGLSVLHAGDGERVWKNTTQLIGATGEQFMRVTTTSDINRDGWRDIAVASIAGPQAFQASESITRHVSGAPDSRAGEVFVYVDWISGQDGTRLSWARHPVPWFSGQMRVCEIDAIRARELSVRGEVEMEIVSGDTDRDAELYAMTLRFQPEYSQATAIANGISVCDAEPQRAGPTVTRVYHQRPGPYRDGDESLVLMVEKPATDLRLGTSRPWICWKNDTTEFLALRCFGREGIEVIDANSRRTIWTDEEMTGIRAVRRMDGSVDFLVQRNPTQQPSLLDGTTGQTVWTAGGGVCGRLVHVQTIPDSSGERLVWIDDGSQSDTPAKPGKLLVVNCLDASTGQRRWTREIAQLSTFEIQNRGFRDFTLSDLDDDGNVDLVGFGFHPDHPGQLIALSGATGQTLWAVSLNVQLRGSNVCRPPLHIFETDQGLRVFTVRKTTNRGREMEAILCDATTGEVISHSPIPDARQWMWHQPYGWPETGAEVIRDAQGRQQIEFVAFFSTRKAGFCRMRIEADRLSEAVRFDPLESKRRGRAGWLVDVCGDKTPERLVYVYSDCRLYCFDWTGEREHWNVQIPPKVASRAFQFDPERRRLITRDLSDELTYSVVDTESGKILATIQQREERYLDEWPLLLPAEADHPESLAVPTDNGLEIRAVEETDGKAKTVTPHSLEDPRLVRTYPVGPLLSRQTLLQMLIYRFKQIVVCTLMFLLPLWYVAKSIKHPRWSLRWLLMGPPIVMIALTLWYSPRPGGSILELFVAGTPTVLGLIGVWRGIRNPRGDGLALVILCTVTATFFFLAYAIEPFRPEGVRYELSPRDVLILACLFVCSSGTLVVLGRAVFDVLGQLPWKRRGAMAE